MSTMVRRIASIKGVYLATWSSSANNLFERQASERRDSGTCSKERQPISRRLEGSSLHPFRTRIIVVIVVEEEGSAAPAVNLVTLYAPSTSSYQFSYAPHSRDHNAPYKNANDRRRVRLKEPQSIVSRSRSKYRPFQKLFPLSLHYR